MRTSWDYGYGDSYWKDQLTSWGSHGTSYFAYDDSGNPTKYKGKTLEWEGKRLAKYNESDNCYVKLNYDGNGLLAGYFYSNTFAARNSSLFKYTYSYKYKNARWYLNYCEILGGYFNSSGKIVSMQ